MPTRQVAPARKTMQQRLWNPYIIVFLSSASIMTIELVASRLIAPRIGVSLYTWTTVIGVILAGISIGNYLGGRLADRFGSTTFLGLILAIASIASLSILLLNHLMADFSVPQWMPLLLGIIVYITIIFLIPCLVLGCVSPIVAKLSLTDLQQSGATIGKIYAWSSVGSIAGTFATGFFLISWFGTKTIILGVAGLLMLMALWFLAARGWRKAVAPAILGVALFVASLFILNETDALAQACKQESNYFCINVHDKDVDETTVRALVLDRLVHSYSNLEDPTHLVYGYEQVYAKVIEPLMERKPTLDAFFIGGGGYTFPRYLEAKLPESHLVVAEIDPQVTQVAYDQLGLSRQTKIESHALDARLYLMQQGQPASYDLIFGDAFNDYSVPYHLTTLEFDQMVGRLLREDGLYVVNIIDGGPRGRFLRAYVRTLQRVFPYVAIIPQGSEWRESVRMTFVIVASRQPLDLSRLPADRQPLSPEEAQAYLDLEPPLILTDEYVPVDNLLIGVFEDSGLD